MPSTLLSVLLILQALPLSRAQLSSQPLLRRDKDARTVTAAILRLEDDRDFAPIEFERFLSLRHVGIRRRAALAIGRIGDRRGIPLLVDTLINDTQPSVREMAAFALGEIEDPRAADSLLARMAMPEEPLEVRARAAEALGKIVSAEGNRQVIGGVTVHFIAQRLVSLLPEGQRKLSDRERLGASLVITALLRVRDETTVPQLVELLSSAVPDVQWQAANALSRMGFPLPGAAKPLLEGLSSKDPLVRASFARALSFAGEPKATDALIHLLADPDQRVVVSAVKELASLKQPAGAEALFDLGKKLTAKIGKAPQEDRLTHPEINLLAEVATALGQLGDPKAVPVLHQMRLLSGQLGSIPEVETALARFGDDAFFDLPENYTPGGTDWRGISNFARGLAILKTERARQQVLGLLSGRAGIKIDERSRPPLLQAMVAALAPEAEDVLRLSLQSEDVYVRAAAAGLLAEVAGPLAEKSLTSAYERAKSDKTNVARIAILSALSRLSAKDGSAAATGLTDPDFGVRLRAALLLSRKGLGNYSANAGKVRTGRKSPFYERVRDEFSSDPVAVLETTKGRIEIELFPRDAPLTVDNFVTLAKAGYFDGLNFHRIVMNFVVQGGDPRGDGEGGPGYQIRCEINQRPFVRGSVGMALSGKDTGGSQFFICHSPEPHLDGGYTVFGQVISGMDVVDRMTRNDRIRQVRIRD